MKIYVLLISVMVLLSSLSMKCSKDDLCIDTKVPEINFGLLLGGEVIFKNSSGVVISSEREAFKMDVHKVYCDGTEKGPFTTEFTIEDDGILVKKGPGYMSYRMDNTMDYMRIGLLIDSPNPPYNFHDFHSPVVIWFDEFKLQDGGNAYVHFTLTKSDNLVSASYTIN